MAKFSKNAWCILFLLIFLNFNSVIAQTIENFNDGFRKEGTINCMIQDSTKGYLYVGGTFGLIDSTHCNGLAFYDGQKWETLGEFTKDNGGYTEINSIEIFENQIFVGGQFNTVSGVRANGMARWDGTNWYPMDSVGFSPDAIIEQILTYKDSLIVLGRFLKVGNQKATHIAKWKNNSWSPIYEEANLIPKQAVALDNELFLVSTKTNITDEIKYLRRYDGFTWHDIFIPINTSIPFWSPTLRQGKDSIFVLGYGYSLCTILDDTLRKIEHYDTLTLGITLFEKGIRESVPSSSFMNSLVNCFAYYKDEIVIGGNFTLFTPQPVISLVKYSSNQFSSMGFVGSIFFNSQSYIYSTMQDSIRKRYYFSGNFKFANQVPVISITYLDSTGFHALGYGLNSYATKMVLFQDTLYAIGSFNKSGNDSVGKLIKWNGTKWESVGKFLGSISNIEVYRNKLFLVGSFTKINDATIRNLAIYDGQQFRNYDSVYHAQNMPNQIYVFNDTLFVFSQRKLRKSTGNFFITLDTDFLPSQFISHSGGFFCTNTNEKAYTFHRYENGIFKSLPFPFENTSNHKLVDIFGRIHVATSGYGWYEFDGNAWSNYYLDESEKTNFTIQSSFKLQDNNYLLAGPNTSIYFGPYLKKLYYGLYILKQEKPSISIFRDKDTLCVDEDFRYYATHNSPFCKLEWNTPGARLSKGYSTYHFSEYDSAGSYPTSCHYYSRYGDGADTFAGPTIVRLCEEDKSPIEFRNVSIYPNPVNDYLIIDPGGFEINTIEIYNLSGQKVFELKELIKTRRTVDLRFLKPGFYFYKSIADPSVDVFKILKL